MATTIYNGLEYSTKSINRNFRIKVNGIVVAEYCSIKEAAQKNDVSTSSISNRMKRKCKPRNGIEYKRIK